MPARDEPPASSPRVYSCGDDLVAAEMTWAAVKSVIYGITIMIVVALFGLVDSPLLVLALLGWQCKGEPKEATTPSIGTGRF